MIFMPIFFLSNHLPGTPYRTQARLGGDPELAAYINSISEGKQLREGGVELNGDLVISLSPGHPTDLAESVVLLHLVSDSVGVGNRSTADRVGPGLQYSYHRIPVRVPGDDEWVHGIAQEENGCSVQDERDEIGTVRPSVNLDVVLRTGPPNKVKSVHVHKRKCRRLGRGASHGRQQSERCSRS